MFCKHLLLLVDTEMHQNLSLPCCPRIPASLLIHSHIFIFEIIANNLKWRGSTALWVSPKMLRLTSSVQPTRRHHILLWKAQHSRRIRIRHRRELQIHTRPDGKTLQHQFGYGLIRLCKHEWHSVLRCIRVCVSFGCSLLRLCHPIQAAPVWSARQ